MKNKYRILQTWDEDFYIQKKVSNIFLNMLGIKWKFVSCKIKTLEIALKLIEYIKKYPIIHNIVK